MLFAIWLLSCNIRKLSNHFQSRECRTILQLSLRRVCLVSSDEENHQRDPTDRETDATEARVGMLHVKWNYANHDERLPPLFKRPLALARHVLPRLSFSVSPSCQPQRATTECFRLYIPLVYSPWRTLIKWIISYLYGSSGNALYLNARYA